MMTATRLLLLFLVLFYTTTISSSTEVHFSYLRVGSSKLKAKTIHVNFNLSYTNPPSVNAWTEKEYYKFDDTFLTAVSNVDTNGFDATVTTTNFDYPGWDENPTLYWSEAPSGTENRIKELQDENSEMKKVQKRIRVKTCGLLQIPSSIKNNKLTANSPYFYPPKWARLYSRIGAGSWKPRNTTAGEWIQVKLNRVETVFAIATQGSHKFKEWTTFYSVSYALDDKDFKNVQDQSGATMVFEGNTDRNTVVLNNLPAPVTARYVRILPVNYHKGMCLRFDVITC